MDLPAASWGFAVVCAWAFCLIPSVIERLKIKMRRALTPTPLPLAGEGNNSLLPLGEGAGTGWPTRWPRARAMSAARYRSHKRNQNPA